MTTPGAPLAKPLMLPPRVRAEVLTAARAAAPREACGLLIGRVGVDANEVLAAAPARNVARRPAERFTLAPADFLTAERRARAEGLEVLGFWHSHPRSAPLPSSVDLAAAWEGYSYLIVSPCVDGAGRIRSWRLAGNEMVEEPVVAPGPALAGKAR